MLLTFKKKSDKQYGVKRKLFNQLLGLQKTYDSEKDVGGRDLELCADHGFLALLLLSLGKNVTYFPKTIISCL